MEFGMYPEPLESIRISSHATHTHSFIHNFICGCDDDVDNGLMVVRWLQWLLLLLLSSLPLSLSLIFSCFAFNLFIYGKYLQGKTRFCLITYLPFRKIINHSMETVDTRMKIPFCSSALHMHNAHTLTQTRSLIHTDCTTTTTKY